MPKTETPKVLLTIDRAHPLWKVAREDTTSAFLPFVLREIIEGNVPEVVIPSSEWVKLQAYLRGLPGGQVALPLAVAEAPQAAPAETSERAVAARKLAAIVREIGAVSPCGGEVTREESGRFYAVGFGYGKRMFGTIFVFSITYVRVCYIADTRDPPPNGLPQQDVRTFASVDDAAKFITLALYGRKYAEALAIPQREKKEKKT